jgi:hypothetical protein
MGGRSTFMPWTEKEVLVQYLPSHVKKVIQNISAGLFSVLNGFELGYKLYVYLWDMFPQFVC